MILLDDKHYEVVGILPAHVRFPGGSTDFFIPAAFTAQESTRHGPGQYAMIGRLRDGTHLKQARSVMHTLSATLQQVYPATNKTYTIHLYPLLEYYVGRHERALWFLMVGASFILLIACANLANVFLSRSTGRAAEIAIRAALGASRLRLVRQLLMEGLVPSIVGGVSAVLVTYGSFSFCRALRVIPTLSHLKPASSELMRFASTCGF